MQRHLNRVAATLCVVPLLALTACKPAADSTAAAASAVQPRAEAAAVTKPDKIWNRFDEFQHELASRVRDKIDGGAPGEDDYQIIVTVFDAPIGTLFRGDRFVPAAQCTPPAQVFKASAPSMFPGRYKMSREVALDAGLDRVGGGVAALDARMKLADTLEFGIGDVSIEELDDDSLQKMLSAKDCLSAVAGKTLRLVRGRILGKRTFSVGSSATGEASAKVAGLASIKASGGIPEDSLGLSDPSPESFLQVVSVISPPRVAPPGSGKPVSASAGEGRTLALSPHQGVVIASAPLSSQAQGPGEIYVQMDKTDPDDGKSVLATLKQFGKVAASIERISPSHMPSHTQVRYFHEPDRAIAEHIVDDLRAHGYPDSSAVRIGLTAPSQQFEVWLARTPPQ